MEILTPSSKSVKSNSGKRKKFICFRPDHYRIAITAQAVEEFVLKSGMKFVFVVELNRLYCYLTKEDGFILRVDKYGNGIINSALLIKTLESKLPSLKRNGPRFEMRYSNTRINDSITFEIVIDKNISKHESSH